jgi:hypothetical protein
MPISGEEDGKVRLLERFYHLVELRHNLVPAPDGEAPAEAEVLLNIDHD